MLSAKQWLKTVYIVVVLAWNPPRYFVCLLYVMYVTLWLSPICQSKHTRFISTVLPRAAESICI